MDTIENILPTSNEDEMKKLMKDLDREQAYREHKCWRLSAFPGYKTNAKEHLTMV